ncbi:MAG: HesB/IscA family protein [Verrucomicrobiales bacterium]
MIKLTPSAENHLNRLLATDNNKRTLRLWVSKGGCAGMEYQMKVTEPLTSDTTIQVNDVQISIDTESIKFLEGATLDYNDDLNDSGLKINNPNATRSCGCGTSFEPTNNNGV